MSFRAAPLSQEQFNALAARGCTRIPLMREALADLETPLSTFLKLAARPYSYLLESVQGGEKWGRYSIIGLPCRRRMEIRGKQIRVIDFDYNGGDFTGGGDAIVSESEHDDPLNYIREMIAAQKIPTAAELNEAAMPRFCGGLVGFFGYDTVRYIESHLGANPVSDPVAAPDILLMQSDEVVVFDNLSGRLCAVVHADASQKNSYARAQDRLREILNELAKPLPNKITGGGDGETTTGDGKNDDDINSSFAREDFLRAVEKCKKYIYEGDVFQVVISRRMSMPFSAAPLDLYRALRTLNPSPYMYYLHLGGYHIAGASPEILVRLEDGRVTLRPLAGTRPRGKNDAEDAKLATELLADPKERAEHMMLVDLGRNDVGRVARTGSVAVTEKMAVEKFSHVMHIVSNVEGEIKNGLDAIDVLKAAFPAGTLSGAPKVRAMEIIEEIEPDKRGIYSGAIGYIGWNGNLDTAIAIRTALIKNKTVYVQAGGGIVADSVPANEWDESVAKGRAVVRAVAMAHAGLRAPRN